MFQQTFVPHSDAARKPFSLGLSLVLQAAVLAVVAVFPLFYTPGLPALQLRSLMLAPPPPARPFVVHEAVPVNRVYTSHCFQFHPDTIDRVAPVKQQAMEIAGAPVLAVDGATGDANVFAPGILDASGSAPPPPPSPVRVQTKATEPHAVRMTSSIAEANLVQKVQPVYPPLARNARVSGSVEFSATINKQGMIENLQLVRGHPLLVKAAREAILQWRYKPTVLNGQEVAVVTTILVTFHLN